MRHITDLDVPFADTATLPGCGETLPGAEPPVAAPYRLTQPDYVSDPAHYAARRVPRQRGMLIHRLLHYFSRCEHLIAPPWRLVLRDDGGHGHWNEKPGVHLQCCICGLEAIRRYDLTVNPTLKFRVLGG